MSPRDQIYQALFSLVTDTPEIRRSSRRLVHWSEVPPGDQPALFMSQKGEVATVATRLPTVWRFNVELWLYSNSSGDMQTPPMSILNPIVDTIVAKLMPPEHVGEQTLGGLVERCRIDGQIETDEGVLGDQAVVIIPITLFVPQ